MSDFTDTYEAFFGGFPSATRSVTQIPRTNSINSAMVAGFPSATATQQDQSEFGTPSNSLQRWQTGQRAPVPLTPTESAFETASQKRFFVTGRIDAHAPLVGGNSGFTPNNEWAAMFNTHMAPTPQATVPQYMGNDGQIHSGYSWDRAEAMNQKILNARNPYTPPQNSPDISTLPTNFTPNNVT